MTQFLINEYYKWSPINIFHLFLSWGVLGLSHVVLGEPIVMCIVAGLMILTYFMVIIRSRLSYVLNTISVASYAYVLYDVGLLASSLVFGAILTPLSLFVTVYIYSRQIYIQDYEDEIKTRGFLENSHFIFLTLVVCIYVATGMYIFGMLGVGVFHIFDLLYSIFYLLGVVLVYYARYEFQIAITISDALSVLIWTLMLMTFGVGFAFILSTVIGFGSARLLLVWWITNKR